MGEEAGPDSDTIRGQVRDKYRAVALDPGHAFGFHTGRAVGADNSVTVADLVSCAG